MEQSLGSLTKREREILAHLVQRLSNQEIAESLYLSVATVKWYNTQIFEKLGVKNRAEAIRLFARSRQPTPKHQAISSLPVESTPFIGRSAELHDLSRLLSDVKVRLITILAPGGMGKTRLAIECAAQNAKAFSRGVCFVPLAPIAAPADLVVALGNALGLTFHGTSESSAQLLDFLHNQNLLLVLDNFEHLLAAAILVTEIVTAAPQVKVLLTSREKLHLNVETTYVLDGMSVPAGRTDPFASDAVQLFLYHARRVRHDLQEEDVESITRIARLTQGMPLGLMLAATWVDVLSPQQIADEINRSIDVLQHEIRDVPVRHRSIRAVFDPTWQRLSPTQQEIFMRLSIFRGGFTRVATDGVMGVDVRVLSELAGKSLIQLQPNHRYAIHELLRQYGESHLNTSQSAVAAYTAHSAFFIDFLVQRQDDVFGRRQLAALGEISEDYENIRWAWLWALDHAQVDAVGQALECLVIAGELTGKWLETRTLLQQSITSVGTLAPALGKRILVRLARIDSVLRTETGSQVAGPTLVEEILTDAHTRGDQREMIWCLWVLAGQEANIYARDTQAQRYYERLIALCRETGNDFFLAHGLTSISWRYANGDRIADAVAALREAIDIRYRIGDVKNLDYVTAQLAWLTFDQLREAASAEALLDEQIALQNQATTTSILPIMFGLKAAMAFWRGEVDAAVQLAQSGLTIAGNFNYLGGQSIAKGALGLTQIYRGDYRQAQLLCQDVDGAGFSSLTAFMPHWVLAFAAFMLGDETGSRSRLRIALQIACRYKSPTFQAMGILLAMLILEKSNPNRAVEYLAYCLKLPPHLTQWLRSWPMLDEVSARIQGQIGAEEFAAAWARGQVLDLNRVAAAELAAL